MTDPKLRTPLLTESVKGLQLRQDAKYPTEIDYDIKAAEDHRQMILAWRRAQEKVIFRRVK